MTGAPLTLGTAGHIDHGKTALVRALTGFDTDRLAEERRRGISIVLGYAPLLLPSGRRVSVVDVPGHERFVRTMVAGATGIDLYVMVVAADDGVMPQTVEHAEVLRALGVTTGVVAVTKADLADPARASAEARELLPGAAAVVACSALTGDGVAEVAAALDAAAATLPGRATTPGPTVLHIDRAFSVKGIGTVVTGTLWSGTLRAGETLALLPGDRSVRVRSVQVHEVDVDEAAAGQRVAVNLAGVRARDVTRGDVLTLPGARAEATVLDCALELRADAHHGERVHVHHGARESPARLSDLGDGLWQLRLEQPLVAADGDHLVIRRLSPPDTLGGGTVLDAAAHRHGRRPEILARLTARRDGRPEPPPAGAENPRAGETGGRRFAAAARGSAAGSSPAAGGSAAGGSTAAEASLAASGSPAGDAAAGRRSLAAGGSAGGAAVGRRSPAAGGSNAGGAAVGRRSPAAAEPPPAAVLAAADTLEARLREAGTALLSDAQLDDDRALAHLRDTGRAVRVSGRLYAHADVVAEVRVRILALLDATGSVSLAEVRDALGISRKPTQAFLEHLDAERVTRRLPDDRRVPRARAKVETP